MNTNALIILATAFKKWLDQQAYEASLKERTEQLKSVGLTFTTGEIGA
jgi:hypothetical protein